MGEWACEVKGLCVWYYDTTQNGASGGMAKRDPAGPLARLAPLMGSVALTCLGHAGVVWIAHQR